MAFSFIKSRLDRDREKDIDSDIEKEKVKKGKTDFDYVSEKLDKVIGKTNESVKKECYSYLKYLSLEVVLYGITITEKAKMPCWNYTKKVLDDFKAKKIFTFNQLLEYLDKIDKEKSNYKHQTHYSFMDDMHSEEEWEALYDN